MTIFVGVEVGSIDVDCRIGKSQLGFWVTFLGTPAIACIGLHRSADATSRGGGRHIRDRMGHHAVENSILIMQDGFVLDIDHIETALVVGTIQIGADTSFELHGQTRLFRQLLRSGIDHHSRFSIDDSTNSQELSGEDCGLFDAGIRW